MPKVTVILTSKNHAKYLREAIDSVLNQTYSDFELFIWDDASTDNSWEIIQEYRDPRIKIFRNDESLRGIHGLNKTIGEIAKGDYIAVHHSDDIWEVEKLAKQVAYLDANLQIGAVFTHAGAIGENSLPLSDKAHFYSSIFFQPNRTRYEWLRFFFFHGNALCHPSVLIRKECYSECGTYRYGLAQLGDFDMWVRLCLKYEIHVLQESLVLFRVRDGEANSSGQRPETRIRSYTEYFQVLNNYFKIPDIIEFNKIFPESWFNSKDDEFVSEYVLSQLELKANVGPIHKAHAVLTLYNLMMNADTSKVLKDVYSFDYRDLVSVGGSHDIFSIERQVMAGVKSPDIPSKPIVAENQMARWAKEEFKSRKADVGIVVRTASEPCLDAGKHVYGIDKQWVRAAREKLVIGNTLNEVNKAVENCAAEWVLILREGDVCDPSLIFTLSRNIEQHPGWELIYFDEAQLDSNQQLVNRHYKQDINIDYLRSIPYCGNAFAVRKALFKMLGGFDARYDGIEEYEFILRAFEGIGADRIGHVSGTLIIHKPGINMSQRPLTEILESGRQALDGHLARLGVAAEVEHGSLPATYRVRYRHVERPLVSIIIPTRNQRAMLERCLESLFAYTAWENFEILIIDNNSDEDDALQYLHGLRVLGEELDGRIRVIDYPYAFNYSAMNNLAATEARGAYLLLLNNDTAALHEDWLDAMMTHAQRPEVGVVGAKLLYPDGKVQHAGVVLGMKGPAEHPFVGREAKEPGYYARLQVDQNYSAVTGACLLVRRTLFEAVGGLDESKLAVSYSDIDLCLKVREQGYLVVWTPHALLLHEGSKSQKGGIEKVADAAKVERFSREQAVMYQRWLPRMANDPAYNRYLSLGSTEYLAESDPALQWDPSWRPVPRIITQPADRMGCGEYRIIAPTRALINSGRIQGLESERIYTPPELARISPDALVLQRQVEAHQIDAIERHKRFNDVFCVFDIDDLVNNVPVKNVHKKHLPKDLYKRLRRAVSVCDRLVVSTEALAEAYKELSADVRVVPNFIEDARWGGLQPRRRAGRKPRVGWAGGVSHTGDLELIEGVVEALKDEVEWVFFGMCSERMRPHVHEFHGPVPLEQYAQRLAGLNLDLAIAPLEDVAFNHSKSSLRLLEYGILGYPVVCSDLTPYRGDFPVTRVRNRFRDWVEAIRGHMADLDATAAQGDALRGHVRQHWLLENNLDRWLQGWLPDSQN